MNLHEYQGKDLLRAAGIPVPPGEVARTAAEAVAIADRLGYPAVVKAQVLIGGRGKAGGVKVVQSAEELAREAGRILGMEIRGHRVHRVLVTPSAAIEREYYAGIVLDRKSEAPILMVSPAGGVDIEEVARTTPEKILRLHLDGRGLPGYRARAAARFLDPRWEIQRALVPVLIRLAAVYHENDASLAEINPLVVTAEKGVWALDAKVVIDDNALDRHPDLAALRDLAAEDPGEVEARDSGLSYVRLDGGTIGCVVNGAGLAMATMDLIQYYGGKPANFLDIGGSSNPDKVTAAMKILTWDARVRAVLFNIFGGITRGDDVARGLIAALDRMKVKIPIVIRLTGTNEKEARDLLGARGMTALSDMDEAVRTVIARAAEAA
ncbi:MAG: ADP-forming succinate--CoA ligase subunit beta [Candidatus Eisenbacteria bacterium]|uniref:Succinate--CoA ligase [ADP-forming] subunit beta n=1 Tax=Eiseniibacteriota bacterium TaxID=2212470 RepID=A0A538TMD8_UNCEI|nr:MAG: ADP-forming succinate--CoA ligase subunit beta [Candidatus Eisenbacteria bacterium]